MKEVTYKDVWDKLSKVDVSKHIEKVPAYGNKELSYLSWAWAWGVMMEHYPEATYDFLETEDGTDVCYYKDDSCSVEVVMTIGNLTRSMWLPVMDNKHKAVNNPNALQISNAKMRCLTKCLAMWGLGHYIYAGEDLPKNPYYPTEAEKGRFSTLLESDYYKGRKNKVKEWWLTLESQQAVAKGLEAMEKQVNQFNEK